MSALVGERLPTTTLGRLRVLVVIDSFSFGGAENLLAVLAGVAPQAGLELTVASLAPRSQGRTALQGRLEEAGLPVRFLDVPRLAAPRAVPRLVRAIRASGCDVVHAHLGYSAILAPVAARLAGRPCVATLHHVPEDQPLRERVKERLAVAVPGWLGRLVFVSDASRREFARRHRPVTGRWQVLHNGVDLERFWPGPDTFPPDVPIPPGAPTVVTVAALRGPKGHEVAVRAWHRVLASCPDARLLVVGDGPERAALQAQVDAEGLAGRVVMVGARSDVPRLLRASTLAALPSLTEALPTALIEAAACGRASVATDVGGTAEVVVPGETGLLVPPRDPDALADAVVGLLSNHVQRARMERAARRLATERFDATAWARGLAEIYAEVGAVPSPPKPRRR